MSIERLAALATPEAPPPASLRGRRYGEDRLHLLVRDPRRVFTTWEVSEGLARRAAERSAAAGAGSAARYALVIERAAAPGGEPIETIEIALADALGGEGWYVDLPRGGGFARALLGLQLPSGFDPLLQSRWIPVPPDGPCAEEGAWLLDEAQRAWLAAEAERVRGREARSLPSSAARYLASPQAPKP